MRELCGYTGWRALARMRGYQTAQPVFSRLSHRELMEQHLPT